MTTGLPRARGLRRKMMSRIDIEGLETRMVMSASMLHAAKAHAVEVAAQGSAANSIRGRITDQDTGRPMAQVKVELVDASGDTVQTTRTNSRGFYALHPKHAGAYVVHEVAPRGYSQASPTFLEGKPSGDYAPGHGRSSWNYRAGNANPSNGPVGISHWDEIAPAGKRPFESPINLSGPTVDLGQYLSVDYQAATPKAIVNNGAQIQTQFNASASDGVMVGGEAFELLQLHFHDTSENTLNGQAFPMEVHFVNESESGAETVVGVFVTLGAHNDAFDPILDAATADLGHAGTTTTIAAPLNLAGLLPASTQGYFFQGTLTTPPLSGPINWFVYATPIAIDYAQLRQYEAVADASGFLPNNRPVQRLDGRRLNEFNIDVDFAGGKVGGLDFTVARHSSTKAARKDV